VSDYPQALTPAGHVEPVPRRVRAFLGPDCVLDTTAARYVWEWPAFPQFYVPVADVAPGVLVDEEIEEDRPLGRARRHAVRDGDTARAAAAWVPTTGELAGTVRFRWGALDAWFEEDEQVFVHPRSPYARVDALRSSRRVRIELDGVVLADSATPVLVFETGLPTRHYLARTHVRFEHLVASDTVTECPYKGRTSAYWSVRTPGGVVTDLAWSYDFPTAALLPIAGLVAFYDEKVDTYVDGRLRERPVTHFSR
jgi:uncharacterized protein (DUF427 family)